MTGHSNVQNTPQSYKDQDRLDAILADLAAPEAEGLREVWAMAGDAEPVSAVTRVSTWNRIAESTAAPSRSVAVRPVLRLFSLPSVRRYALAASVVLFAALGYLALPHDTVYHADAGTTMEVTLADGSAVTLAPGAALRVAPAFGEDDRVVRLEGEAFFDVSSSTVNQGQSFVVETFNASVEVLGTAFNVRALESDLLSDTRVAVEHGLVRVEGESETVLLEAGQGTLVTVASAPAPAAPVDLERVLAWRDGDLAFDAVPMGVVFKELEQRFGVRIKATESIRRMDVSYWRAAPLEIGAVLADLADVVAADLRRTANGYEIYQAER
jgi:ferric-dicitrate binding protein FerR (iron transport regulator)